MTPGDSTPPQPANTTYWQAVSTSPPDYQILPRLRVRLVALVAALVVQATIALLGVLPDLPVARDVSDASFYVSPQVNFWNQFAVIGFLTAVVVSAAFGPGARFSDVPAVGRLVLALGFVAVPAALIVLGAIDAAQEAARSGPAAAASSWLTTAFFGILFFGLPLIALAAGPSRATPEPTGQVRV